MNEQKCIDILKRMKGAPESARTGLIQELVQEAFADNSPPSTPAEEIHLVIDSIVASKPARAEVDMLGVIRNKLARATDPEKIAVLHQCVKRLREL